MPAAGHWAPWLRRLLERQPPLQQQERLGSRHAGCLLGAGRVRVTPRPTPCLPPVSHPRARECWRGSGPALLLCSWAVPCRHCVCYAAAVANCCLPLCRRRAVLCAQANSGISAPVRHGTMTTSLSAPHHSWACTSSATPVLSLSGVSLRCSIRLRSRRLRLCRRPSVHRRLRLCRRPSVRCRLGLCGGRRLGLCGRHRLILCRRGRATSLRPPPPRQLWYNSLPIFLARLCSPSISSNTSIWWHKTLEVSEHNCLMGAVC